MVSYLDEQTDGRMLAGGGGQERSMGGWRRKKMGGYDSWEIVNDW